jgi:hypothetical protein
MRLTLLKAKGRSQEVAFNYRLTKYERQDLESYLRLRALEAQPSLRFPKAAPRFLNVLFRRAVSDWFSERDRPQPDYLPDYETASVLRKIA